MTNKESGIPDPVIVIQSLKI